jgi:Protein of unknown function (DUF1003)
MPETSTHGWLKRRERPLQSSDSALDDQQQRESSHEQPLHSPAGDPVLARRGAFLGVLQQSRIDWLRQLVWNQEPADGLVRLLDRLARELARPPLVLDDAHRLAGVESYPFGLLTMIVSLEAIFLSTFVMISQNRADARRQVIADQQWTTVDHGRRGGQAERRGA